MTAITTNPKNSTGTRVVSEGNTEREMYSSLKLYKRILQSSSTFFVYCETQINFVEEIDVEFDVNEEDMNSFAYVSSEPSLREFWEDEDDDYWNSYLD